MSEHKSGHDAAFGAGMMFPSPYGFLPPGYGHGHGPMVLTGAGGMGMYGRHAYAMRGHLPQHLGQQPPSPVGTTTPAAVAAAAVAAAEAAKPRRGRPSREQLALRGANHKCSKYKGVSWDKTMKSWRCKINSVHVGYFENEIDAAKAYDEACVLVRGKDRRKLNFPENAHLLERNNNNSNNKSRLSDAAKKSIAMTKVDRDGGAGPKSGKDDSGEEYVPSDGNDSSGAPNPAVKPGPLVRLQARSRGSSQYRGVLWDRAAKAWRAKIKAQGKTKYLGLHRNEVSAGRAYDLAAVSLRGSAAHLNFPRDYPELLKEGDELNLPATLPLASMQEGKMPKNIDVSKIRSKVDWTPEQDAAFIDAMRDDPYLMDAARCGKTAYPLGGTSIKAMLTLLVTEPSRNEKVIGERLAELAYTHFPHLDAPEDDSDGDGANGTAKADSGEEKDEDEQEKDDEEVAKNKSPMTRLAAQKAQKMNTMVRERMDQMRERGRRRSEDEGKFTEAIAMLSAEMKERKAESDEGGGDAGEKEVGATSKKRKGRRVDADEAGQSSATETSDEAMGAGDATISRRGRRASRRREIAQEKECAADKGGEEEKEEEEEEEEGNACVAATEDEDEDEDSENTAKKGGSRGDAVAEAAEATSKVLREAGLVGTSEQDQRIARLVAQELVRFLPAVVSAVKSSLKQDSQDADERRRKRHEKRKRRASAASGDAAKKKKSRRRERERERGDGDADADADAEDVAKSRPRSD